MAKAKSVAAKKTGTNGAKTPKSKLPSAKNKAKTPIKYLDILRVTSAPVDERQKLAIGRKGEKVVPRRFHIDGPKLEQLQEERKENPKSIPNPHNVGAYWLFIEALKALGANKPHAHKTVKAEMKRIGSTADHKTDEGTLWERFNGKEMRNDASGLEVDGRIAQNAYVLQRLGGFTPYGLKLLQCGQLVLRSKGMVIDILKGKDGKERLYRLNTNADQPTNEFRRSKGE